MGFKTAITPLLLLLGVTYGKVDVSITGGWKENVGWNLTCTWSLSNRPLQSVRLYKDDAQFLVYRPEKQGPTHHYESYIEDTKMTVDCQDSGSSGECGLTLEPLAAPVFNTTYKCEVSEEGPRFEMQQKEYVVEVFVPPSYPQVNVSSLDSLTNINCTATGIPAPRLVWRIEEQRIPENFSNRRWDSNSRLWHSWSAVTLTPGESFVLTCETHSARGGRAIQGQRVEVLISSANTIEYPTAGQRPFDFHDSHDRHTPIKANGCAADIMYDGTITVTIANRR